MPSKPSIVADPPELETGDQDVELTLENAPAQTDRVIWSADPPNGEFDGETRKTTWHPANLTAGTVYTILAEVRDATDNAIAKVRRGIVVCRPAVVRKTPQLVAGKPVTYVFSNVPPVKAPRKYFYAIDGVTVNKLDHDKPLTIDEVPKSPFRLSVFSAKPKEGGALPDFEEKDVVVETIEQPAAPPGPRLATRPVSLVRTDRPATPDQILWVCIRNSTNALAFRNFQTFLDIVFCGDIGALCDPNLERRRTFLI
ncbi:MAG: hypothetical protein EHM91_04510, partial [Planctomycetota bacterium]